MQKHLNSNRILKYAMVVDYAIEKEGWLKSENFMERVQESKIESLRRAVVKVKPGEYIHKTTDLFTSPLKVHLVHENKQILEEDYEKLQKIAETAFTLQ